MHEYSIYTHLVQGHVTPLVSNPFNTGNRIHGSAGGNAANSSGDAARGALQTWGHRVQILLYIHTHTHAHIYTHVHTYIHTYVLTHMYVYIYTHMYTCVYIIYICIHTYTYMCIHICIKYMYTYI